MRSMTSEDHFSRWEFLADRLDGTLARMADDLSTIALSQERIERAVGLSPSATGKLSPMVSPSASRAPTQDEHNILSLRGSNSSTGGHNGVGGASPFFSEDSHRVRNHTTINGTLLGTSSAAGTLSIEVQSPVPRLSGQRYATIRRTSAWNGATNPNLRINDMLKEFMEAQDDQLSMDDVEDLTEGILNAKYSALASKMLAEGEVVTDPRYWILDPYSIRRVAYDISSVVMLIFEIIVIPIVLAWDLPLSGWLKFTSLFGLIFWTVDIFLSFFTGYYSKGDLEMRPRKIALRYIKSWFVLDVAVVSIDAVSFFLATSDPNASVSGAALFRLSKMSRFMRLARLVRLFKVSEVLARVAERSAVRGMELAIETLKPFWVILFMNHMMACAWYGVAQYTHTDTGVSWLDGELTGSVTYRETNMGYQYLTALHWALTQMTPGSMQVSPQNSNERIYNFFCLLLGMIVFSSIISSLSAKLNQHQRKEREKAQRLVEMRRFLRNKAVSSRTAVAVMKQAEESMTFSSAKPTVLRDLAGLSLLSQSMQKRLHYELCSLHLRHPLLRWWAAFDDSGVQAFAQESLEFQALAPADNLFIPRERATGAYLHVSGKLNYYRMQENVEEEGEGPVVPSCQEVVDGACFCEMALWLDWTHVGELTAMSGSEVLLVNVEGMAKVLQNQHVVRQLVVQYGKAFYTCLTDPEVGHAIEMDDLSVQLASFDILLSMLPLQYRQLIGVVALMKARKRDNRARTTEDVEVLQEIKKGKMNLLINSNGDTERIVSLVVVSLQREDGKFLVELGELVDGAAAIDCKLPGKKQKDSETATATLGRVLNGTLCILRDHIVITKTTSHETNQTSKRSSFPTKYLRTMNHGELTCPLSMLGLQAVFISMVTQGSVSTPGRTAAADLAADSFIASDGQGGYFFYSWMDSDEFEFYKTLAGKEILQRMFVGADLTQDALAAATDLYMASKEALQELEPVVVPKSPLAGSIGTVGATTPAESESRNSVTESRRPQEEIMSSICFSRVPV